MLILKSIPINITSPILGKISFSPVQKKHRAATIIAYQTLPKQVPNDYAALICASETINSKVEMHKIPVAYKVQNINLLSEGDVVQILPNGLIHVLYQINSAHNQIFVTSRCNSNCIMCPQPIYCDEKNLTEFNLRLISLIDKKTEELALNGGEPTLLGNELLRLILACKHYLPHTSLLLLSNARKFSDLEFTRLFSSLRHPNITVATALYSDNDIEHDYVAGSKGAFNETITGIINLARFNNLIEIRIIIHKHTYDKLLRISEYIYRNMPFVSHIAFVGLEATWRAKENIHTLWIEPPKIARPLQEAIHYLLQRAMNVSIYNIPFCLLPKQLWVFARQSISEWKNVFESKCRECSMQVGCSGMFASVVNLYKHHLKPVH